MSSQPLTPETGPLISDLVVRHLEEIKALQAKLATEARWPKRELARRGQASGTTDSSGNLFFKLFDAPQSLEWQLSRVVIEAAGYTPGAPFTDADFWAGLYSLPGGTTMTASPAAAHTTFAGYLLDFIPVVSGTQGLPALYESSSKEGGPLIRAGESCWLFINDGPDSTSIWAQYQGVEREA